MDAELQERYFQWLCAKVTTPEVHSQTYWKLLKIMHSTEFVWLVTGDDNRCEDAMDLRVEYGHESGYEAPKETYDPGVSVLETLIAFSRRADFQTMTSAKDWFWEFVQALDLSDAYDAGGVNERKIDRNLRNFVWRTYEYDGSGGLFPLTDPPADQRKVELWDQFCEYLVDQDRY